MADQSLLLSREQLYTLLSQRRQRAANATKCMGADQASETVEDLLLDLDYANVLFCQAVIKLRNKIVDKHSHSILEFSQAIAHWSLFGLLLFLWQTVREVIFCRGGLVRLASTRRAPDAAFPADANVHGRQAAYSSVAFISNISIASSLPISGGRFLQGRSAYVGHRCYTTYAYRHTSRGGSITSDRGTLEAVHDASGLQSALASPGRHSIGDSGPCEQGHLITYIQIKVFP